MYTQCPRFGLYLLLLLWKHTHKGSHLCTVTVYLPLFPFSLCKSQKCLLIHQKHYTLRNTYSLCAIKIQYEFSYYIKLGIQIDWICLMHTKCSYSSSHRLDWTASHSYTFTFIEHRLFPYHIFVCNLRESFNTFCCFCCWFSLALTQALFSE